MLIKSPCSPRAHLLLFSRSAAGVPLVFFIRLKMHSEVLAAPAPRWQLGFLYRDYTDRYYFFECVELVRKFLLVRATGGPRRAQSV